MFAYILRFSYYGFNLIYGIKKLSVTGCVCGRMCVRGKTSSAYNLIFTGIMYVILARDLSGQYHKLSNHHLFMHL